MTWRARSWFGCRLLFVLVVPVGAQAGANIVINTLEVDVPAVHAKVVLGLCFLALACALLQKVARCTKGLRWLPVGYAIVVVLIVPGAVDAVRDLGAEHLARTSGSRITMDVVLVEPPRAFVPQQALELGAELRKARSWDLKLSLASAQPMGSRFRLRLPAWRRNAARAIVLDVDAIHARVIGPTSTDSLPKDWAPLLGRNTRGVPVFAILRTADGARLQAWRRWAARTGGNGIRGTAARLRDTGSSLVLAAGLGLATRQRDALHAKLAWLYRPQLFLDYEERYPRPLDVDRFLSSGKVKLCGSVNWGTRCGDPADRSTLAAAEPYLEFDPEDFRGPDVESAIYYHVVPRGERLYLDYWWYFPYNPTAVGSKALCGAAFMTTLTCFDHASDWEGVTVVLRGRNGVFRPESAVYAQHEHGVAYGWSDLVGRWRSELGHDGLRPVVFVAKDTHASYPSRCVAGCAQVKGGRVRREGAHDGRVPWAMNDESACARACLKRLPHTRTGDPAGWNASPFAWGSKSCFGPTHICDVGAAPLAPSYQPRYSRPWVPQSGVKVPDFRSFEVTFSTY